MPEFSSFEVGFLCGAAVVFICMGYPMWQYAQAFKQVREETDKLQVNADELALKGELLRQRIAGPQDQ